MIYKILYVKAPNKNMDHFIKRVGFLLKTAFMKRHFGRKNNGYAGKLAEYSGRADGYE